MIHLSGMDASFLHLETPESPMHVGSLQLLDLPAGYEGDFAEDAKKYLSGRLHLASVFVRKLTMMPFDLANPVWVDDDDLDLDHHIHHVIMPRPGTMAQLERLVGRLHSTLIDRSRPLWEIHIIEGLQTGQVALYSKMHHAAIDGQAGVAVAKALFDISETAFGREGAARHASPRFVATRYGRTCKRGDQQQLVAVHQAHPVDPVHGEGHHDRADARVRSHGPAHLRVAQGREDRAEDAAECIDHQPALIRRTFRADGRDQEDVQGHEHQPERHRPGAICAGALRRYLADYGCKPAKPLIAAVPVSLRSEGNTDFNNQVSTMLVSLATDISDPLERLAASFTNRRAKARNSPATSRRRYRWTFLRWACRRWCRVWRRSMAARASPTS